MNFRPLPITFLLLIILALNNCQSIGNKTMLNTSEPSFFYVGTYTDGESHGIYRYVLYPGGKMEAMGLSAAAKNPSYLALSPDKKFLLAINEIKNDDNVGTIESYLISGDNCKLLNRQSSGGAHPCFLAVNQSGYVLTANYTGGNVGLLKLDDQGRLGPLLDIQQHEGSGGTDRQKGPHAHSVWFKPGSDEIISIDLGTNDLWFSTLDQETETLIPGNPPRLAMEKGAGPRMLAFHPNGSWLYVVNELNSSVTLLKEGESSYEIIDSFSTLPESHLEPNTCAHILVSADGRFLYASNRGHDSIAVFEILEDGKLSLRGHKSTGGKGPRNFSFSPDETFILVANQHTNNIVSLKRNSQNGLLKYASQVEAPTPVCVVF